MLAVDSQEEPQALGLKRPRRYWGAPKWSPARIEDLPRERVAAMLAPLGEHELTFDQQAGEERP